MIRSILAALAVASMAMPAAAQTPAPRVAPGDMRWVAPTLAGYTDEVLFGQVWRGPELGPRDRSLVTLSALVAGGNTAQMTSHLNRALDNGVKPSEIGGLITHLAFYSGWPQSVSALAVTRQVLEARGAPGSSAAARDVRGWVGSGPSLSDWRVSATDSMETLGRFAPGMAAALRLPMMTRRLIFIWPGRTKVHDAIDLVASLDLPALRQLLRGHRAGGVPGFRRAVRLVSVSR